MARSLGKSATIDIGIMIDVDSLISYVTNPSQEWDNPTPVPHHFAYMVAASEYVASGQATGDLAVNASVEDSVRWRSISIEGNTEYATIIYNIQKFGGVQVTGTVTSSVAHLPYPEPTNPQVIPPTAAPTYKKTTGFDYRLSATIDNSGTEKYLISFYVVERQRDGSLKTVGYFYWDPTLTVN